MDKLIILIVVLFVVIIGINIYIGMTPSKIIDESVPDLKNVSCSYVEDGVSKIRDECILECEEQGGEFTVYEDNFIEVEDGVKEETVFNYNQNGELVEQTITVPNMVYERQETATTYTFPPTCNAFCKDCYILQ